MTCDVHELAEGPGVEETLLALGVRVLCRGNAATRQQEVPQDVLDGLDGDVPMALRPTGMPAAEVHRGQLGVVVEHLLEVGDLPMAVDGVAGEPATDVVTEAAGRHLVEREIEHLPRLGPPRRFGGVQEELEDGCLGELGGAAEAAMGVVEGALHRRERSPEVLLRDPRGALRCRSPDRQGESFRLLEQVVPTGLPRLVDRSAHLGERGHAVAWRRGEVRTGEEGPPVGSEPDRHRPAAPSGHRLHGVHVDAIDVGPFLAVDLHVHKPLVHQRGGGVVLE